MIQLTSNTLKSCVHGRSNSINCAMTIFCQCRRVGPKRHTLSPSQTGQYRQFNRHPCQHPYGLSLCSLSLFSNTALDEMRALICLVKPQKQMCSEQLFHYFSTQYSTLSNRPHGSNSRHGVTDSEKLIKSMDQINVMELGRW